MSAKDKERYYWLKLDRGFFKRHDITILECLPNGKDYVLFYLKLMLESVDHAGELRFSEMIPYDANMLASITNTNFDIVRGALDALQELGMVEIWDDRTIYMEQVAKLLGSETHSAKRQRELRANKAGDNVALLSHECRQEIDTDIDTEIDTDIESEIEESPQNIVIEIPLKDGSMYPIYDLNIRELSALYPAVDIMQEIRKMVGWSNGNPQKRKTRAGIKRFINAWLAKEQDKGSHKPANKMDDFYAVADRWSES
ncbi:MAG: phage replisome organizer N-terminal domain-containing protein [Bacteroidaceae bacterium]|nr:phage replisome organizer N-terminal domain-containing protein [Bacteroidaceae bacterium]